MIDNMYLLNIEVQNIFHVSRELIYDGEVTENAARVRYHNSPDGSRGDN